VSAEVLLHTIHEKAHLCAADPHFHNWELVASIRGDFARGCVWRPGLKHKEILGSSCDDLGQHWLRHWPTRSLILFEKSGIPTKFAALSKEDGMTQKEFIKGKFRDNRFLDKRSIAPRARKSVIDKVLGLFSGR
jgi:hypothetical protein